jgi:hypothetical protein
VTGSCKLSIAQTIISAWSCMASSLLHAKLFVEARGVLQGSTVSVIVVVFANQDCADHLDACPPMIDQ